MSYERVKDLGPGDENNCSVMALVNAVGCSYDLAAAALGHAGRNKHEGATLDVLDACLQSVRILSVLTGRRARFYRCHAIEANVTLARVRHALLDRPGRFYVTTGRHAVATVDGVELDILAKPTYGSARVDRVYKLNYLRKRS